MRRRLWFMLAAVIACVSFLQVQAQVPYLPKKAALGNTLASGDFSTFAPTGDYTLEAAMQEGQSIDVRNENSLGFIYKAKVKGVHRFAVKGNLVHVFNDNKFIETLRDYPGMASEVFPDIFSGTDDADAQTGIYDELNLFKNPGFEEGPTYSSNSGVRFKPADWYIPNDYNVATSCRVHDIYANNDYQVLRSVTEGKRVLMMHGVVIPFGQKMENLKPGTWYKATWRQMFHKDTYPPVEMSAYLAKDPNGAVDATNAYSVYKYHAQSGYAMPFGSYQDVTYCFRTPDVLPADLYFVIKRTGAPNTLQHYDRMTLVEANAFTGGLALSGVSEVTYENEAVIPEVTVDGQNYDMTSFVVNPDMDDLTGWKSTTKAQNSTLAGNQQGAFVNTFWENWNGSNYTGKLYQVVTGLPNGEYILEAATFADREGAGLYLYANDQKVLANTKVPTTHTVGFTVLDGTAEIGLNAEQETNNWIGLDNVRLYYKGYGDTYLADALAALETAMTEATALQSQKIGTANSELLTSVLAQAATAKDSEDGEVVDAALSALNDAIAKAEETVAAYASLDKAITAANANKVAYEELGGYAAFEAAIATAQGISDAAEVDNASVVSAIADLKEAEKVCRFTQATPFDASFLIENPDFASGFNGWAHANVPATSNEYKVTTFNEKTCWNSWSNNFTKMDVFQVLKNVPAGVYKLSGYTATDGVPYDQHLYAKTSSGTAVSPAAELLTGSNSGRPFATPWEELETTEFIVGQDGEIRIGMASTSNGGTSGWFSVTGFELTCLSLTGAPVAPVAPELGEFELPAEVKPVVTGDYVIYHPASQKYLASSSEGDYVRLSDFDYLKNVEAYAWDIQISGDNSDNMTMKQLSSDKYVNTSLDSWNTWDMVFDSPRAEKWLLKNLPDGGYTISSMVKSTGNVVGVDGITGNPVGVYANKGTANNPLFKFIDKATFMAIPEVVAYSALLDTYNEEYAKYLPAKVIYDAQQTLLKAVEEANSYILVDSVSYIDGAKEMFAAVIEAAKVLYLADPSAVTLEELQTATTALKEAQYTYRVAVVATDNDPVDFTFLIVNPTMTGSTNGWTSTTDAANKQLKTEDPNREIAFNGTYMENWKASNMGAGKIYQTISGLPKGKYTFKLAVFNAKANETDGTYVFANEYETLADNIDPTYFEVEANVMDGTLDIGLRVVANVTNWVGIDNASLKYCGYGIGMLISTLNTEIAKAEALTDVMQTSVSEALATAIADGKEKANESSTSEELEAAIAALTASIEAAQSSIADYENLDAAIAKAGISIVADEAEVVAAIQTAGDVYTGHTMDGTGVVAAIKALESAVNAAIVAKGNGDATLLIANPKIEQTGTITTRPAGWENSMNKGANGNFTKHAGTEAEPVDTYLESWSSNVATIVFDYNQVLANIPNGVYVLKAATFTENSSGNAVLYGNKVTVPMKTGVNGDTFTKESEVNTELTVIVTDDTLRLGIKTIGTLSGGAWSGADNFRLIYCGTETDFVAALQKELTDSLAVAEEMDSPLIVKGEMNKLVAAITAGNAVKESTDIAELDAAIKPLKVAIVATYTSIDLCMELIGLFAEATELIKDYGALVDPAALQAVLKKNQDMYEEQTDDTDNATILAAKAEIEAALAAYKDEIKTIGVGEIGADEVKVYVDGSSIVVEGADYEIYTIGGVKVPADAQLVPGTYIVRFADQAVKVQVK